MCWWRMHMLLRKYISKVLLHFPLNTQRKEVESDQRFVKSWVRENWLQNLGPLTQKQYHFGKYLAGWHKLNNLRCRAYSLLAQLSTCMRRQLISIDFDFIKFGKHAKSKGFVSSNFVCSKWHSKCWKFVYLRYLLLPNKVVHVQFCMQSNFPVKPRWPGF